MPRILYNPLTSELIRWPRVDEADVVGLEPPVVMLTIEQEVAPEYDPAAYRLAPTDDVDLDSGVLRRGWELVLVPPATPTPRWVEFALVLATNSAINQWYYSLLTPQTSVLFGMVSVGLGQAAKGDPMTFLAAWGDAIAAELVPPGLAEQMASLAAGFDLPVEFVEGLG